MNYDKPITEYTLSEIIRELHNIDNRIKNNTSPCEDCANLNCITQLIQHIARERYNDFALAEKHRRGY